MLKASGYFIKVCVICDQAMRHVKVPTYIPWEQRTKYALEIAKKEHYIDKDITPCQYRL